MTSYRPDEDLYFQWCLKAVLCLSLTFIQNVRVELSVSPEGCECHSLPGRPCAEVNYLLLSAPLYLDEITLVAGESKSDGSGFQMSRSLKMTNLKKCVPGLGTKSNLVLTLPFSSCWKLVSALRCWVLLPWAAIHCRSHW